MDYYGTDRKLSELGEQDLEDFLDQDMFTPPTNDTAMETFGLVDNCEDTPMDSQWLDNFFDDPVLNDRMMTDALQPRRVQSEHSYSLTNGERICIDSQVKEETPEKDLDVDLLGSAINPNMTMTAAPVTSMNTTYIDTTPTQIYIKQEPNFCQNEITMATNSIATTPVPVSMTTTTTRTNTQQPHPHTLLKQPTIILATHHSSLGGDTGALQSATAAMAPCAQQKERLVLPKVNIKVETFDTASNLSSPEHTTMYDSIGLPPTPPSSNNSDSEGCQSPQRSAPPSPIRHSQLLRQHAQTQHTLGGASAALSQPLFTSPIPTSGMLMLSDEEKRTLVAEGYPIPNKLPLTKQEEKNLKKIRRKIKNKISAQESRRKKKEYLETLEKKVESYNSENCDLKKKVELLENNNRSLLGQLQKLQSLVSKVPRPPTPSTQTGTCLMVLVLFFAVFIGSWSPLTWSIGYSSVHTSSPMSAPKSLGAIHIHGPSGQPIGPEVKEPMTDAYSTPNMRSRVLLSIRDEQEETFGPNMPFTYENLFGRWFTGDKASCAGEGLGVTAEPQVDFTISAPQVQTVRDSAVDRGGADDTTPVDHISLNYTAKVMTSHHVNTTA